MYQFENFPIIGKRIDENPEQIVVSGEELIPILIDGVTKYIKLSNLIINAEPGNDGDPGDKGWSPVIGIFSASDKKVFKVVNWIGGQGSKPAYGQYIGINGLVSNISDAVQIDVNLPLKADLVGGKVPQSQLPSYVDDVLEFADFSAFPSTGESGKIYVALDTNLQYRYTGSAYIAYSGGASLPPGGSSGFALVKKSDADNDAEWVDIGAKDSVVTSGGDMSFTSGTLTVDPTSYKIKGTAYSKTSATNFTGIALSATNKQRWGIVYGTTSNTILKIEEAETDTDVTLKPILPANSCLIGEFLIGDEEATIVFPDLSIYAKIDDVNNERDFVAKTTGTGASYIARHPFRRTRGLRNNDEFRIRVHTPNTTDNFTFKLECRLGITLNTTLFVADKNGLNIPIGMFKGDVLLRYVGDQTPRQWRAINIDASKLEATDIYNGLDQTSSGKALDARQGKILNDVIGDKNSLITTFKNNLVGAINEIKSSIAGFVNKAGDTFTGTITTAQSNATSAALRITPGVQKTTGILDGDIDFNNSFLRIRINGVWQNMFFVPSNPTSLRLLSQSSSGNVLNNIEVVDPLVSSSALDAATWTTETLTLTGIQGQESYGNEYAYKCIGTNTWIRTPRGLKRIDMWLGDIDDSGGLKTTAQLNAAYPNAVLSQRLRGNNGIYEKFAPSWRYFASTTV